jgi:hypothetical protein
VNQSLRIDADWDGRRVTAVQVVLRRPSGAPLLVGRSAAEVVEWVPRLYSLCAKAQGVAARLALNAARGRPLIEDEKAAREILAEQAREHLWRLLRDWPPLLGVASRDADLAHWFRRLANADATVGSELLDYIKMDLLDAAPHDWMQLRMDEDIAAWARGSAAHGAALVAALLDDHTEAVGVPFLDPRLGGSDFAVANWHGDFAQTPTWCGSPAETGAFARWRSHPLLRGGDGLLARLLARLLDLADVAGRLSDESLLASLADASCVADNVGLARVDTARGMLLHRVEMKGDKVADYAVVAPTEWNFHPRGGFAAAAAAIRGDDGDTVRRDVSRWVLAFDPCVDWSLEVRRA